MTELMIFLLCFFLWWGGGVLSGQIWVAARPTGGLLQVPRPGDESTRAPLQPDED